MDEFGQKSLRLPPLYRLIELAPQQDAVDRACQGAMQGAEPATVYWSRRNDRAEFAVVLAPDAPVQQSALVAYVAMQGLGDALGSLVPPAVAVTFGWPDRIEVNGGIAGGIRLVAPHLPELDQVPDWIVLGVVLQVALNPEDPGHNKDFTSLHDEGCGELTAAVIVEAFARHFLYWMNRWQTDGIDPVLRGWRARATGNREIAEMPLGGDVFAAKIKDIDRSGMLLVEAAGKPLAFELAEALRQPTWALPQPSPSAAGPHTP